jgi:uncharacterized protein YkwD
MLAIVAAVVLILVVAPTSAFATFKPGIYRETLLSQINYYRTHHHLAPLVWNTDLQRSAAAHSTNMARYHLFSHYSSTGVSWSTRIRYYGFRGSWIGENLAVGLFKPYKMFSMWVASPPHNANLLCSHFRSAGIGVVMGTWAGHLAIYVTADFGGP